MIITKALIISYLYIWVYSFSIFAFFAIIYQIAVVNFKTLYFFKNFSFQSFYILILTCFLFSIAGVPPFIGFFPKLLILLNLINGNFFFFFIFFTIILMLSLYFYLQNIRFLHSITNSNTNQSVSFFITRVSTGINYFLIIILFIIIAGFYLLDEIYLYFCWIIT